MICNRSEKVLFYSYPDGMQTEDYILVSAFKYHIMMNDRRLILLIKYVEKKGLDTYSEWTLYNIHRIFTENHLTNDERYAKFVLELEEQLRKDYEND